MESEYLRRRNNNVEENRKVLRELGLLTKYEDVPKRPPKAVKRVPMVVKRSLQKQDEIISAAENDIENEEFSSTTRRRSKRLKGKLPSASSEDESTEVFEKSKRLIRENVFGAISGVAIGTLFDSRLESSRAGVHRPTVAGIHGSEAEGCYSLALSGGYEDDVDLGDCFTYTGEGGRDLKGTKANPKNLRTAPQSKNQTLTRGNLALTKNVTNRRPVRVIRGYKLTSAYAPETGYRYDGLYTVEKYWEATGLSGFLVYKYVLERCEDQDPAPWAPNAADVSSKQDEDIQAMNDDKKTEKPSPMETEQEKDSSGKAEEEEEIQVVSEDAKSAMSPQQEEKIQDVIDTDSAMKPSAIDNQQEE